MAEGYTNRVPLRVDGSDLQRAARDMMNWSRTLPFAQVGLHCYSSVDSASIANGAEANVVFDTVVYDRESWIASTASTFSQFTVPKGKSGVYLAVANMRFGSPAGVFISITVNGLSEASFNSGAAQDRVLMSGILELQDDDVVAVHVLNLTGGAITVTAIAQNANNPNMPYFKLTRLSYLT